MINKYNVCLAAFLAGLVFPVLSAEYQADAIEKKGDLFYVKETGEPLTGTLIRNLPGGKIQSMFENGVLNGESRGYFENGKTNHIITFKDNMKDGLFKQFDENGNLLIQANYKNNKLNGEFITYYPGGKPNMKETYQNDMLNGPKTTYYETGILKSQADYIHNQQEGVTKTYYDNGTLQSEFAFKNNQRNGIGKIYYPNGKIQFEMNYINDKLTGENKNYREDGTLIQKRIYQNGLVESGIIYQDNKELPLTTEQIEELNSKTVIHTQQNSVEKEGLRIDLKTQKPISGIYLVLNDKGFASQEFQYLKGKPHGLMQAFDAQGNIIEQAFYQEGQKVAYQQRDANGKVIKLCQIENGKEICQ